ncbi:MAG: PA2169 family four-helix-bundle protein [Xanthomonadales bacterium]|nr:PA2169 family four-helix-bundle protein [Xanthomonadales bacterium]
MEHADKLQELVSIARDGERFYDEAGKEVSDPTLKMLFLRMADHKRNLIRALSTRLAANYEDVPTDGTFAGTVRRLYADLRASVSDNEAKVYVTQLEETEDRLLEHFQSAIDSINDPALRAALLRYAPDVRACHDEMRTQKLRLAA